MLLYVVQIIELPSLTELHSEHTCSGVVPVDSWSLDIAKVLEHGRELLLIVSLVTEVEFVREVGPHLSGQPLEMEVWEHVRHTRHQQLGGGECNTV